MIAWMIRYLDSTLSHFINFIISLYRHNFIQRIKLRALSFFFKWGFVDLYHSRCSLLGKQGDVVRSMGRWIGDADDVHRRESAGEVRYGYLHNLLLASSPAPTPLISTSLVRAASFGRGQLLTPAPSWTILTPSWTIAD